VRPGRTNVAEEISENRFKISGGKAGSKVSWQVTSVRHDAYEDAHRVKVEGKRQANRILGAAEFLC
jgi:hypothetical protein